MDITTQDITSQNKTEMHATNFCGIEQLFVLNDCLWIKDYFGF